MLRRLPALLLARGAPRSDRAPHDEAGRRESAAGDSAWSTALKSIALWGVDLARPGGAARAWPRLGHVFSQEALFFSKVAIVTFGGAYAVLAYVAQQAVENYHWLRPDEMLTGLGLAETTPGPLILVLVFVGFLAGARGETGLDPLLAGTIGAFVTLWVTFAPSFLFIFAGAPFVERLRGNRYVAGALAAVTAAVVGVIANLGAVVRPARALRRGGGGEALDRSALPLPDPSTFDWRPP